MHQFPVLLRHILLFVILFGVQQFWFRRGWRLTALSRWTWVRWAGRAFLALSAVAIALVLYDRIFDKVLSPAVSAVIAPPVQLWLFTSIFALFCVKGVNAAGWIWAKVARFRSARRAPAPVHIGGSSRRSFLRYAASIAGTLPFFAAVYGFARERLRFETVRVDVPIKNLPPALDGFRIVQLSDIHIGDFMPPDEIRRAVDIANGLGAHLAVITGDFITSEGDPLEDCVAELSRLHAPLGVWGCNGNHEIYADAENEAESLFARRGMKLLRQSASQLRWNDAGFNLIGVDYQREMQLSGSMASPLSSVEALIRPGMPNILLSHNPNAFYRAAELGVDLTLAGHTHGGQINIEIVRRSWNPARFMTKFVAGLYHLPNAASPEGSHRAWLYVNRGLGTMGVPARLGAAPEITLLTLRSA